VPPHSQTGTSSEWRRRPSPELQCRLDGVSCWIVAPVSKNQDLMNNWESIIWSLKGQFVEFGDFTIFYWRNKMDFETNSWNLEIENVPSLH
jgi:hypothetical protein